MVLPMTDIEEVRASRGSRLTYHGLRLIVRGSEELILNLALPSQEMIFKSCS